MSLESVLRAKVEKVAEKIVQERANQIYGECVELGRYAISQFYDAYTPKQYHRTDSFHNVCLPFSHRLSSMRYEVGLIILDGVAVGHKDKLGDEYVFHGVMEMGVHGTSQIAKTTPPMEVIRDYFAQFG